MTADLPESLHELARSVARGTRLWRGEKADVLAELETHFRDGLEDGRDAGELAESFGDPQQAARLIRRARKRQRPLVWRVLRRCVQATAAFIVLYALGVLYFISGTPNPTVDYHALSNARALAVTGDDRAWPLYRDVLVRLGEPFDFEEARPGDDAWAPMAAYLDEHAAEFADLRAAAAKPGLGFVVGFDLAPADAALYPDHQPRATASSSSWERSMYAVLLPYLGDMRRTGKLLMYDAWRAADAGDGATAVANIEAMLGISAHAREIPFLINDLVSSALAVAAAEATGGIVARFPDAFDDTHLHRLAHRLAAADDLFGVRLEGERYGWHDLVQRIYTDDGEGDGRVTRHGLQALEFMTTIPGTERPPSKVGVATAAGPLLLATMMTRREALAEHERLLRQMERAAEVPAWEWTDGGPAAAADFEIEKWASSWRTKVRYFPLVVLMPALGRATTGKWFGLVRRDAALAALALELDRRRRGAWAPDLDALVPGLLPAAPRDVFDGAPLRYTLVDGRPRLYSIGNDRDDDGGRPYEPTSAETAHWNRSANWTRSADAPNSVDGDWILWPPMP